MTPLSLVILGATTVCSSFVSGVFGMAGGMILLGVLLVYFDVATGMVLFSIIQLAANGWRALHWRQFVIWGIFWRYVAGALIAFVAMRYVAFVPDKATVYLLLGLMPFTVAVLPDAHRPNIEWRGVPFITGICTTIIQFMAGVGGMFLDIFFNRSKFDRKTTNATKAVTQTFSHILRAGYFGSFAAFHELQLPTVGGAVVLALVGSICAPFVVERMTDDGFRRWTRAVIYSIAIVYLARAGVLFYRRF